jgi:hypothetical protein
VCVYILKKITKKKEKRRKKKKQTILTFEGNFTN